MVSVCSSTALAFSCLCLVVTTAFQVSVPTTATLPGVKDGRSRFQMSTVEDPFENYSSDSTSLVTKDVVEGSGQSATVGDILTVKYTGRLCSFDENQEKQGEEFDSGVFSFKLGEGKVIPGWDEGLVGQKVGGQRKLLIPPNLAYGNRGGGDKIPPNAHLEFDCELKGISSGPVAEFMASTGLGLNTRTLFIVLFILSIVLPKLGIGQQGFL